MPRSVFVGSILTALAIAVGMASLLLGSSLSTSPTNPWLGLLVLMSVVWGLLHVVAFVLSLVGVVESRRAGHGTAIAVAGLVVNAIGSVPAAFLSFVWIVTAMLVAAAGSAGFVH